MLYTTTPEVPAAAQQVLYAPADFRCPPPPLPHAAHRALHSGHTPKLVWLADRHDGMRKPGGAITAAVRDEGNDSEH